MPTNTTEWRERLVTWTYPGFRRKPLSELNTYLTALLREWDAHGPKWEDASGLVSALCRCDDLLDSDGLCPARRRMMGGGDGPA